MLSDSFYAWRNDHRRLIFLVYLTALSSVFHYLHNIVYFAHYPEPAWLNPILVDAFWLFMTPFAGLGLFFHFKNRRRWAKLFLVTYALMNMLTLLHYGCEIKIPISLTIHFFIWFETICALALLVFLVRNPSKPVGA